MISAAGILRRVYGMFARVFPRCGVISQAIAFNLFLAFFPALLIAVALATSRIGGKTSLFDLIADLTQFLPPASKVPSIQGGESSCFRSPSPDSETIPWLPAVRTV